MKRKEIISLYNSIPTLHNLEGVKLSYAVVKTVKGLEIEIKALQEAIKPSPEFQDFENQRLALCKKYAQKDEKGEPIIENNQYKGLENNRDFETEMENLKAKYKDALEKREKQMREYEQLLEEEAVVHIHKIKLDDVPQNITVSQMAILEKFIEE